MSFGIWSDAFKDGERIPVRYTADGDDLSPPLAWGTPPEGTESLALICDDPDAPNGTWVHWVLFNLPPSMQQLPEGVATERRPRIGGTQGTNDFGNFGFGGPAPPKGHGRHRYYFKLYALDVELPLDAGARKENVVQSMRDNILAETQMMGTYERP